MWPDSRLKQIYKCMFFSKLVLVVIFMHFGAQSGIQITWLLFLYWQGRDLIDEIDILNDVGIGELDMGQFEQDRLINYIEISNNSSLTGTGIDLTNVIDLINDLFFHQLFFPFQVNQPSVVFKERKKKRKKEYLFPNHST